MLLPDSFLRLPPAAAVLVLSTILETTNAADSSPRQTQTVELRELHVLPWPPAATVAPRYPPVLYGLHQRRQLNTVCGFIGGDPDLPATCSAGSHCVAEIGNSAIGCCPDEGPCTQGIYTGCVDANRGPQTELNPYVYTCTGNSVCYKNQFEGDYYQWGCGSSSGLATNVAATAPGQSAPELVSISVALTAEPTSLSEPTIIGTITSGRTSASSTVEETSTSDAATSTERFSTSGTSESATATSSSESTGSGTTTATNSDPTNTGGAPAAPPADGDNSTNTGAIVGGTLGGIAGAALLITAIFLLLRRRRRGNVRQGPGPNQGTEYISSPIDGNYGHNFAPLPPQAQEMTHIETPKDPPLTYAHPGDRMHEYDHMASSPYVRRDSDDYSQDIGGGPTAIAIASSGRQLEQDQIPLTRDVDAFQPPTETRLQNIQEEEPNTVSPMTPYPPRSRNGSSALWHQNRQTTRNPTWIFTRLSPVGLCKQYTMPSTKGKPTDPQLREELKEEIIQEPNKSGGGEGQWSAWKANKLAKEYEKQGGDYENEAGSKNEPKKGNPQHKSEGKKKSETGE
ncbi:hypothetical protein HJFPF1_06241 [Paramyrothecium foliicola]|nr:hypothetical protein HJFPF1_06241 [Paramyrothecium foliicola]